MLTRLNAGCRLPIGITVALGALIVAPVAGAQETTQTECETFFTESGEFENCPSQTGPSTSTQLFTFVNDLRTRIVQQRKAKRMLQAQEQQTASGGMLLGGAASADGDEVGGVSAYGRLSPFVIVDIADADRERTDAGKAYDQDTESVILGADYRVNDTLFIGGTLNYLNGDTDFANDAGSIDVDSYILGLHGSKYWGNSLFMDALVTYGQLESDIVRNVNTFTQQRYTASPDGEELSAEVAVGYEYSEGRNRITPLAKLHYFDGSLDGYTEDGPAFFFPGPQTVGKQDFDAVNLQLALQADTALLMNWGVLIPSVNISYYREFSDANTVEVSSGGFAGTQKPDGPDHHTFVVRLGASAQFTHGWSAFASFEKLLHHDYLDRNNAVLGVRYEIF